MVAVNPTAYDEVLYPSYVYPQTHPDRLATLAMLLGMAPAPVTQCRVLELACGDGANLIPMALELSQSEFVGIDLAASPIVKGQEMIRTLGLKNIALRQCDLMSFSRQFGRFDYIIAHGLYSWVDERVREHILEICRDSLSPNGVGYISYNAYPGCYLRQIARGLMLFHSKDIAESGEKIRQSRGVLRWAAEARSPTDSYTKLLNELNERLEKRLDSSVYHDELAEINTPFYFHEFIRAAARHQLQFLTEADHFESSMDSNFSQAVIEQLDQLGRENILAREQYLDFLKGRSFRQTLLCHGEVKVTRPIDEKVIERLLIRSEVRPNSAAPDITSTQTEEFITRNDARVATDLPLAKAAFTQLANSAPHAIPFRELLSQARMLTGAPDTTHDEDSERLATVIAKAYEVGVVQLHTFEPSFAVTPSDKPVASPLARLQAKQSHIVTTLLHKSLRLDDELGLKLLSLLDGSRGRSELVAELKRTIEQNDRWTPAEKADLIADLPKRLDGRLEEMGRLGLLVA